MSIGYHYNKNEVQDWNGTRCAGQQFCMAERLDQVNQKIQQKTNRVCGNPAGQKVFDCRYQ